MSSWSLPEDAFLLHRTLFAKKGQFEQAACRCQGDALVNRRAFPASRQASTIQAATHYRPKRSAQQSNCAVRSGASQTCAGRRELPRLRFSSHLRLRRAGAKDTANAPLVSKSVRWHSREFRPQSGNGYPTSWPSVDSTSRHGTRKKTLPTCNPQDHESRFPRCIRTTDESTQEYAASTSSHPTRRARSLTSAGPSGAWPIRPLPHLAGTQRPSFRASDAVEKSEASK